MLTDIEHENMMLKMELDYLKRTEHLSGSGKAGERHRAIIISEMKEIYPLKDLLTVAGIPRSTYYYHLNYRRKDKYSAIRKEIADIFSENSGRYGYRRITAVLRSRGYKINHKPVLRLMNDMELKARQRTTGKYNSYKGEFGVSPENILNRDFRADKPFEKLTTDITQFNVCGKKVYLSPVMDLFNREILSYSISFSPNMVMIREMLFKLFDKLPEGAEPLFHSDRGWQYQHPDYKMLLKSRNIRISMSRKGNCIDNGAMENFFGRLKVEMYYGERFNSVNEFINKLENYIEYYNNKRISLKLKGLSPVEYRTQSKYA